MLPVPRWEGFFAVAQNRKEGSLTRGWGGCVPIGLFTGRRAPLLTGLFELLYGFVLDNFSILSDSGWGAVPYTAYRSTAPTLSTLSGSVKLAREKTCPPFSTVLRMASSTRS